VTRALISLRSTLMKYSELLVRRREILERLVAQYLRELATHRELIESASWRDPDRLPEI
jgi:hypothetical protein